MYYINKKIASVIDELKQAELRGCITGSCLWCNEYNDEGKLVVDMDTWDAMPDIDVFAYSDLAMVDIIGYIRNKMGYEFGVDGSERSRKQEWQKYQWVLDGRKNMKFDSALQTVKLNKDNVIINISMKKGQKTVVDVIHNFDMSVIMRGFCMVSKQDVDMRTVVGEHHDKMIADPNRVRMCNFDMYTVKHWLRQWDRVIKYWNRGFDTRPMAKFYLEAIDDVIESGALWTSEAYMTSYEQYMEEYQEVRNKIALWLKAKED